ncbi:MAG: monooxygenase family protein, partial [Deltaproteobacteria bacterium]
AKVHSSSGDVGIWHETYRIHAGEYETIYSSTPRRGLARAGRHVSVTEHRETARQRMAVQASG